MQLVLFDIDGTLIQTGGAGVKAFARAFHEEFHIQNATEGVQFAGRTDTGLLREMLVRSGVAPVPAHFARFFDRYVFWLDHFLGTLPGRVCPGVRSFIAALKDLPDPPLLGLLTGNIRLGAEIKLRHFGLWELFSVGAFADDDENRNCISAIAHARGNLVRGRIIPTTQVLVIGDTPHDIECGRAISAKTLAVATGSSSLAELQRHQPTWAAENMEGLDVSHFLAADQTA